MKIFSVWSAHRFIIQLGLHLHERAAVGEPFLFELGVLYGELACVPNKTKVFCVEGLLSSLCFRLVIENLGKTKMLVQYSCKSTFSTY